MARLGSQNDVLLADAAVAHQRAHQCQRGEGRRVQFDGVAVRDGVVQVQLHGYLFAALVAPVTAPVLAVEVAEQCFPRFLGVVFARQHGDSLPHHRVSLLLIVPTVLHPETRTAVPLRHTRCMDPCHAARMDATALAEGLVRAHEKVRSASVQVAEEQATAVGCLVQRLNGGRRAEVGLLP